jgi:hypothetical protein
MMFVILSPIPLLVSSTIDRLCREARDVSSTVEICCRMLESGIDEKSQAVETAKGEGPFYNASPAALKVRNQS